MPRGPVTTAKRTVSLPLDLLERADRLLMIRPRADFPRGFSGLLADALKLHLDHLERQEGLGLIPGPKHDRL